MNVSTRGTRARLTTLGTSFSTQTVTNALQPECTRKPTAACFMEASAAEERGDLIYIVALEKSRPFSRLVHSLRLLAFHHFSNNFTGARGVVGQHVKFRASSLLIHAAADPILVKSGNQEIAGLALIG